MTAENNWWEYPTNYSNGTSVDGAGKFFVKYPSHIIGDYWAMGIILMIFVMSFAMSLIVGTKKALAVSGFITLIFAVWFMRLGSINPIVVIGLVLITIVGIIGGKSEASY